MELGLNNRRNSLTLFILLVFSYKRITHAGTGDIKPEENYHCLHNVLVAKKDYGQAKGLTETQKVLLFAYSHTHTQIHTHAHTHAHEH